MAHKEVSVLQESFKQHYGSNLSKNMLHDLLISSKSGKTLDWEGGETTNLSKIVHDALSLHLKNCLPPELLRIVQQRKKIEWKGLTYSTSQHNRKNAFIVFTVDGMTQAGLIQEIFLHRRSKEKYEWIVEPFCAVLPLKSLSEAEQDPYAKYPLLDIRLYHNQYEQLVVISLHDIVSHAASCRITYPSIANDLLVMQSLDRVCALYFWFRLFN